MKDYKSCSDKELVDGFCQRKDNNAFDEIYRRYIDDVYGFVYSRVMNTQTSEDIVSETFITLLTCLGSFNGSAKLKTFIIGIAVNKIRHTFRDRQRRKEVYLDEDLFGDEDIGDYDEENENKYDTLVQKILSLLPEKYRYILEHIYIQQETIEQIAQHFKITQNNARVLHHRALKKALELSNSIPI